MIVLAAPLHLQEDALVFERPLSLVVAVAVSVVGDVPFREVPKHLLPPVAPPARQICKITSLANANFATAWPRRRAVGHGRCPAARCRQRRFGALGREQQMTSEQI